MATVEVPTQPPTQEMTDATATPKAKGAPKTTLTFKSQLKAFRVSTVQKGMRDWTRGQCTKTASIYLTAVLEYLASELLFLSSKKAGDKKKRIMPHHLQNCLSVHEDLDMARLFSDFTFAGAGAYPTNIPTLKQKKATEKAIKQYKEREAANRKRALKKMKREKAARAKAVATARG